MATKVSALPEITIADDADALMVVDATDGASKKISRGNLLGTALGGYLTGRELWRWNRTDATQFDPVIYHGNSTGVKSGTVALSFADPGFGMGNVLRMQGASLVGGAVFALAAGEVVLPNRYVVSVVFSDITITGLQCSVMPFCNLTTLDGVAITAGRGGNVPLVQALVGDVLNGSEAIAGASVLATGHTDRRGGMRLLSTVMRRPQGETPSAAYIANEFRHGSGTMFYDGADVTAISTVGINWNGQTHGQVALGCFSEAATSHVADIADLKIYAHPDD